MDDLAHKADLLWYTVQALLIRQVNNQIGHETDQETLDRINKFVFRPDTSAAPDGIDSDTLLIGWYVRQLQTSGESFIGESPRLSSIRPSVERAFQSYVSAWFKWETNRGNTEVGEQTPVENLHIEAVMSSDMPKEKVASTAESGTPESAGVQPQHTVNTSPSRAYNPDDTDLNADSGKKRSTKDAALKDTESSSNKKPRQELDVVQDESVIEA
ncbi:hypothetical protein K491DRAFT_681819 [Lophiostoma macrostomum CBS 122681]|uniref:Uncharacterized protein n=1 Tax=Lophiostoma macrostomum CBS 122681 TaxID=1314788 RepID=A0A6A6SW99_9PLEO|nr:hypothetical protein K491DRAFT_681819 [Lophiostoma macrostomum CBS 122681]